MLIEATPDNAQGVLNSFLAAGLGTAALTTADQILANEITVFNDRIRIDVQTSTPGISFEDAWKKRVTRTYSGQDLLVLSLEDLIASKRAAGRPQDLEDVRMLETMAN